MSHAADAREAFASVAVPVPLHRAFDYRVPAAMRARVCLGSRVLVPFGGRTLTGFVVALSGEPSAEVAEVRDVLEVLDEAPSVSPEILGLCRFIAEYYVAPLGEVLRAAVPAGIEHGLDRRVSLTEEGRLRVGLAKGVEGKIFDALEGGAKPWRDVVRHGASHIEALAAAGLVEIAGVAIAPRLKKKRVPYALLAREPTADDEASLARAPKQRAMLAALRATPERSVASLREAHGEVADALSRLVERGLARIEERDLLRDPFAKSAPPTPHPPPALTKEQSRALAVLDAAIDARAYAGFLLQGVTGSGKTEVYLRAIEHALAVGRNALVLVPEISLTPQLADRFRARFGDEVAILHSGLSGGERYDQWRRLRGEIGTPARIAIGARSAIFAPLDHIGVVVVDEEHDASFKQEEAPRYHARDLALLRAQRAGAVAILGTATPSLESLHNAQKGKLRLLTLAERVHARPMPDMHVIDLEQVEIVGQRSALLSRELADALTETVRAGEQAILFLNRRGYSSFVKCRGCRHVFECRSCSISLTHHRGIGRLLCHYCGYSEPMPRRCPVCQGTDVGSPGVGTERIEDALRGLVPGARVGRLDRDAVTSRARLEAILSAFARREIDVLVGTQMLAKGHDFPGVTLVGVVYADQGLRFPDFRARERTYHLVRQVAGRAGRGSRPGRVLVQTYRPDDTTIVAALRGDDAGFYTTELAEREAVGYPPFGRLIAIRCEGTDARVTREQAHAIGRAAHALAQRAPYKGRVTVLGPAEAPIARIKGKTRWILLLRGPRGEDLRRIAREVAHVEAHGKSARKVRVIVDVDPQNML